MKNQTEAAQDKVRELKSNIGNDKLSFLIAVEGMESASARGKSSPVKAGRRNKG